MLLLNLVFTALAAAIPIGDLVIHEERQSSRTIHDDRTIESQRVDPHAILPIRIALAQSNLDKGYDHLMRVSDPDSEHFGKHWTLEEIHQYFAPSAETREAVVTWLESAGINRDDILEPASSGWLGIDVAASYAERLFDTEYYETHGANGIVDVGCDKYHVPAHLSNHIDFITPGIGASSLQKQSRPVASQLQQLEAELYERSISRKDFTNRPCGRLITPACIRALYNIPTENRYHQKNALGVFEDPTDTYAQEDLDLFFKNFMNEIPQGTHPKLVSIDGATAPTTTRNGGGESSVDLTLTFSLIYPQNVTLYQTTEYLESLLNAIDGSYCTAPVRKRGLGCGTTFLTQVLSVSWGQAEISKPFRFAQRACNEYMKLGLKGHTLLFSSGDLGPMNYIYGNEVGCIDPQNPWRNGKVFSPSFPATCPYVLSVGATQLNGDETTDGPETTLHQPGRPFGYPDYVTFSSSGGFSNYFREPNYQSHAVSKYLSEQNPGYKTYEFPGGSKVGANGGLYARGGRAFPDVAANGAKLANYQHGKFNQSYGTSLSTPIWASLITLINDERATKGKGPVGFINPTLYKNPQVFNDITLGNAPGCGTEGFAAAPGWDPTTGLGTPIFPKLREVLLALP